jgi:hypothetical protein
MEIVPCRDCSWPLPADARGCPQCGRNATAERRVARAVALVAAVAAVAAVAVVAFLSLGLFR